MKRGRSGSRQSRTPSSRVGVSAKPTPGPSGPVRTGTPELRGFLWAVAIIASLTLALLLGNRKVAPSISPTSPNADNAVSAERAKELEAAVARNPQDVEARLELVRIYLNRKNLKEAWKETKEALRLAPDDARALTYEGLIRLAGGQPEAAVGPLKAAIAKNPDLIEPRLQLAYAYLCLDLPADADATIEAATKRFPTKSDSINRLAAKMRQQATQEGRSLGGRAADAGTAAENRNVAR